MFGRRPARLETVDVLDAPTTGPRTMDPILLIGSMILLAAVLTWILPAGRFERIRDSQTGRTVVVPGSYNPVPRNPVGPWGILQSIPQGLTEAAEVVFFVLLAGAAIAVIEGTGALGNFINQLMHRFGSRPLLVLAIVSMLFLVGGATTSMYEEILAFVPVLCLLMRRLHLDPVMAVGVSLGTATVAASFSPVNTFLLGISQPIAELALFSGFAFRTVIFAVAMAIWGGYLAWYARRVRADDVITREETSNLHSAAESRWNPRDAWVLTVMNAGMATMVFGGIFLHWEIRQFSAIYVLMALAAGLVGGLGWRGTSEQFADGMRRLALAAALVGFARAISVILANGRILDTIANALFTPLRHLPSSLAAAMMFVSESALGFPMPSDSGRAIMSLPIVIPVADLLGLSRQTVIYAYQYGSIVSGLITPTTGGLLAILAVAKVPYGAWLRFMVVPFVLLSVLSAVAIVIAVKMGFD